MTQDLEIPKSPTQTLKYKRAYLMLQAINYYKDIKSAHIIVTTFLLHYCERWRCYMSAKIYIHLLSKSLNQVNVLETVLFLFTATLYTLIFDHNLSEYL